MQHFHKGRRDRFFKEWNDSLHPSVRDGDAVAKKLEFYLNIYFAIFPIKFARGQVIKHDLYMRERGEGERERGMSI